VGFKEFLPTFERAEHIANGTNLRNAGWGTVRLRGVPPRSTLLNATLYWGLILPNDTAGPPPFMTVTIEGHRTTGALIGIAREPCWNAAGIYVLYAANVNAFIPPAINGDYQVDCFPSKVTTAENPWEFVDTGFTMAEGASLVVIFTNPNILLGNVYTHTGPAYFDNTITINHNLNPVAPPNSLLRHTRIGADGQVGGGLISLLPTTDERTFINALQIKGPTSPLNGDSDWNGDDGGPLNQLWDTHTDEFESVISAGAANYTVRYVSPNGDCVNPSVHVVTIK